MVANGRLDCSIFIFMKKTFFFAKNKVKRLRKNKICHIYIASLTCRMIIFFTCMAKLETDNMFAKGKE